MTAEGRAQRRDGDKEVNDVAALGTARPERAARGNRSHTETLGGVRDLEDTLDQWHSPHQDHMCNIFYTPPRAEFRD